MGKSSSFFTRLLKPFTSHRNREDRDEVDIEKIAEQDKKNFSYQVLVKATRNFHQSLKLGEGGFGAVYQGTLDDGRKIAVKRLSQRSTQGKKEFQNEAKLLARVQHRNVVHLLGFCAHDEEKLLIYEFVVNDSLDKLLFKSDKREFLDWKRRYDVITGVAKGLLYLHEEAHNTIIHRDIKASNILLDDKWSPKIADFGMARLFLEDDTHVNTRAAGTNGYMAPEYLMHGKLSKKADVFSYGVVVLELISGEKNSTFSRDPDSDNLLEWAYKLYKKNRALEIIDQAMVLTPDSEQTITFCIWLGLQCVQADPNHRPTMGRVVVMLSRKPSSLEEPSRPGYPGSRYRRYRRTAASSSAGTFDTSSSHSNESTHTQSVSMSASTSGITSPRRYTRNPQRDSRGKQPMKH